MRKIKFPLMNRADNLVHRIISWKAFTNGFKKIILLSWFSTLTQSLGTYNLTQLSYNLIHQLTLLKPIPTFVKNSVKCSKFFKYYQICIYPFITFWLICEMWAEKRPHEWLGGVLGVLGLAPSAHISQINQKVIKGYKNLIFLNRFFYL